MQTKDWFVVGISGAALIWSIISYFLNKASAKKAGERADAANRIAEQTDRRLTAESELSVLRLINEARMKVGELFVRITDLQSGRLPSKLTADETRLLASLQLAYEGAVEALLNSYELACGLYLDGGKLDDERFRRQYHEEIKRLFDFPDPYQKRLHPVNSPYKAIRKVHEQWHNLEKG
jgi:hypothetical protein